MTAFLRKRWPREQDIADIVQESFLRLSNYPNPDTIQNPRAFLFQTAANLAVDRHRRDKVRGRYHSYGEEDTASAIADSKPNPEHFWEQHEALARFSIWLEELPELQRHAFVLFRIEGLSHAEIGRRLGVSVSSSERYVRAAMLHISKRLSEES